MPVTLPATKPGPGGWVVVVVDVDVVGAGADVVGPLAPTLEDPC